MINKNDDKRREKYRKAIVATGKKIFKNHDVVINDTRKLLERRSFDITSDNLALIIEGAVIVHQAQQFSPEMPTATIAALFMLDDEVKEQEKKK